MAQEARLVIAIDSERAKRTAQDLSVELDSITKKGDFASKSMDRMSVATRALAGYMAGLVTVSSAISKMDTYTGLQNRLKLVTNNQVELNKATEDTFRIAQKTYSAWDSVLQVYQRFSDNAKTLNLTMVDTARLTETVSKAVAISGASAQAADAALVQFGQALASGTLRGEELNSVMEQTPALAKAIAQGMGITVGQLRSVAAEGKITSQEIVKALRNVEKDVDTLFAKTDITIGQSLTLLNNEITKFVGEAGKGSGAAQVLAGSIQTLASNLDLIADGALVVGIGYITKAISTKAIAVQASIVASIQNRAATLAEAQSQVQLLGVEAMRAKQSAALALTELSLARSEYNAATSANARAVAVQRLTAAEIAYNVATKEAIATTEAYSNSQKKLNGIQNSSIGIGRGLLGILSGPVGLGFAAAGVAASFLLMSGNSNKAKDALDDQGLSVDELREKYSKLNAEQLKIKALDAEDLKSDELEKIKQAFIGLSQGIQDLQAQGKTNQANALTMYLDDLRAGGERAALALANLESKKVVEPYWIEFAVKWGAAIKSSREEIVKQNQIIDIATGKNTELAKSYGEVTNAVNNQSNALKKLREDANKSMLNDQYWINTYNRNKKLLGEATAKDFADFAQEWRKTNKIGPDVTLTKEQNQILQEQWQLHLKIAAIRDEATNATKEQNKALRDQQKVLNVNAKVLANASKFGFADLESKYKLPSGTLSAIHMIESRGNAKAYNKETGATGGFQFLEGTAKQYGVKDRTDLAQSAEGAAKYMSYLLKLFKGDLEKAVRAYHAGEGNVMKGKGIGKNNNQYWKDYQSYMAGINGYSAGDISSKDFDKLIQDTTKMAEEQAKLRLQLENEVANQVTKIRNDLAKKLEDVDKANFSPERKAEIKAELQARADNDIAIAEQATKTKLDSFRDFTKSEEQLLKDSFAKRQFEAEHDLEMTKEQRKEAVNLLAQQLQQELGLLKLAQEQRLFQARLSLLSETQAMQERYRLEREEILKNTKLSIEERQKLIALSKANQDKETRDKVNNAAQNWGGIQADMNGTGEFFRQDQERFSRLNAANDLADSQFAATDLNEQNSLDGLNAQFEAGLIKQQDYENQKTAIIQAAQDQRNQIAAEYAQNAQDIEDKYHQDRLNAQIALGGQMMGSLTSMFGSMFGEQSKAYKIMFAADKAYAIAAAGIAIQQNIAAASKAGFPLNIPLIAGAVAQGASIIANIRAIKDQGFADGGYTGRGGKYEVAGAVHKGEIVWSQEDIKRWGGVGLVERMRKSANPEAFLNNNALADSVMRRAMMSSSAFIESQKQADIFNQPVQDTQIIYKGNRDTPKLASSGNLDLFHDGKVYFSSNGLVQDRSNLDDVQDFTLGSTSRPQAEMMPSIEPASPTINFKIEVINQVSGATVEAEQLDEQTVRIIVKDELDKQLPRTVPKLVSDQIANPNSTISRSLTENTTARRNRT
ncbi:tape measure protein [Acinetobacter baumannii]|uniref:tape measure protein n=15 Tax=Acinetobacter baumannii TaxID=470 RepID=UPI00145C1E12|nr:tape measure protein [Acinetobacter baumannii]ELY0557816.1 tape measure protein [Acinetobacter baumannii]EMB9044288.1 tape measure protein [Acinetobacter baumannii]MCQ1066539.1 tape measure protein [Acinetobacter baumannii]MDL4662247.1 tape measure protein [Acinetobacter baumannii]QJG98864.1 tape measure protein [Acinetobacter baumannii]